MTVEWQNSKGMDVLKSYVEKIAYPENTEYYDDSSQMLTDILDNDQSSESEESESDEEIDGWNNILCILYVIYYILYMLNEKNLLI